MSIPNHRKVVPASTHAHSSELTDGADQATAVKTQGHPDSIAAAKAAVLTEATEEASPQGERRSRRARPNAGAQ